MNVKQELEDLFKLLDVKPFIRRAIFHGFDTYEEYEKYGDLFMELNEKPLDRSKSN